MVEKSKGNTGKPQMPDFSDFEREDIGFAPFWKPEEQAEGEDPDFIYAIPIGRDERGEFTRYIFKNLMPEQRCHKGPSKGGEDVVVPYGGRFSTSVWSQLQETLDFALACPFPVPMRIIAMFKTETEGGREMWNFDVSMPKETKEKFHEAKMSEERRLLSEGVELKPVG